LSDSDVKHKAHHKHHSKHLHSGESNRTEDIWAEINKMHDNHHSNSSRLQHDHKNYTTKLLQHHNDKIKPWVLFKELKTKLANEISNFKPLQPSALKQLKNLSEIQAIKPPPKFQMLCVSILNAKNEVLDLVYNNVIFAKNECHWAFLAYKGSQRKLDNLVEKTENISSKGLT